MKKSFPLLLELLTLIVLAACQVSTGGGNQPPSSSNSSSMPTDYSKLTVIKVFSGEFSGTIEDIAFSPDGKSLVTASGQNSEWNKYEQIMTNYPGQVLLWNVDSGEFKRMDGLKSKAATVAFSPDGKRLAGAASGQIRIWDLSTGKGESLSDDNVNHYCLAYTAEGQGLVSLGDKGRILDAQTGAVRTVLNLPYLSSNYMALSADGERLVSFKTKGGDFTSGEIAIWNLRSGIAEKNFPWTGSDYRAITLSPDGGIVVTGERSGEVKLFEASTGRLLKSIEGHTDSVKVLSFSPDGNVVATGSDDKTVRLWDVQSGRLIRALNEHGAYSVCIEFSRDGHKLAVAGFSNVVIWSVPNS